METSSQLLYYVDADGTPRNSLVKLLNNWVTAPKMLAEDFVISRGVQARENVPLNCLPCCDANCARYNRTGVMKMSIKTALAALAASKSRCLVHKPTMRV